MLSCCIHVRGGTRGEVGGVMIDDGESRHRPGGQPLYVRLIVQLGTARRRIAWRPRLREGFVYLIR